MIDYLKNLSFKASKLIFLIVSLFIYSDNLAQKPKVNSVSTDSNSVIKYLTEAEYFNSIESFKYSVILDIAKYASTKKYFCENRDKKSYKDRINQKKGLTKIKVFSFVTDMLRIRCGRKDNTFVRWENPVRYYLLGLEKYPELDVLFVKTINKVSRITGLDIKRHKVSHFKYQEKEQRKKGLWPNDNIHTNTVIYLFEDIDEYKSEPLIKALLAEFKTTPERSLRKWLKTHKNDNHDHSSYGGLSIIDYSSDLDEAGLKFVLKTANINSGIENYQGEKSAFSEHSFLVTGGSMITTLYGSQSQYVDSLYAEGSFNRGVKNYTDIDVVMFEAFYKSPVTSGMPKFRAARIISAYMTDKLKIKD